MKKNFRFSLLLLNVAFIAMVFSCKPDKSDDPVDTTDDSLIALNLHINDFIWTGLHDYYLWVDEVPNLSYANFSNEIARLNFLRDYDDHEELFYDLLYRYEVVDRFSWIVDDYEELEQMFQGISTSMGYEFKLGRFSNSDKLFGFVLYVLKGSPAEQAGIKRGDIFVKVNGVEITESNYQNLLMENEMYSLSLAQVINNSLSIKGESPTMRAIEIHENPIFLDTAYYIGTKKIGYLVFNGFIPEYDIQLNNVFSKFKSQNITDLILDLRYNPGGSVSTAVYLASMIYSADTNKIFITQQYNDLLQAYIDETFGPDYSIVKFADKIEAYDENPETPIVSLGLNKLVMITTKSTASASELVLSGLKPYMNITTIGTTTYGKYVGSITVKDYDNKGNINSSHKWAMQPIVMKAVNSIGETDYFYGFAPTDSISEDIEMLSTLGDINEPLLNLAIAHIRGTNKSAFQKSSTGFEFDSYGFSKDFKPLSREMYIRKGFQKDLLKKLNEKNTKALIEK